MATNTTSFTPIQHAKESLLGMTHALEQRFGCEPRLDKGTTLNTKFDTFPNKLPANARHVAFFAWGVGGRVNDDTHLTSAEFALGTNMALYDMRPFRAVPFETDLSAEERAKYGMRVLKMINGTMYCLYYLKRIDFTQSQVQYIRTDSQSGERSSYEINYANLGTATAGPARPVHGSNGVVEDVADSVSVILPGLITLTGQEVYESVAVMDNGDPRFAVASELGFVSASIESVAVTDFAGRPFNYQEAIFAQLVDQYNWTGQSFVSTADVLTRDLSFSMKNLINQS
jgi:hypothetical protein